MKKNKIYYLRDNIIYLGVPARKLAVGLSAHSPRRLSSSPPAGYPLQSLTQTICFLISFSKIVIWQVISYQNNNKAHPFYHIF